MTINHNLWAWLEAEVPAANQAPTSDPTTGATAVGQDQAPGAAAPVPEQEDDDDVEQDPQAPEVDQEEEIKDFEQWRHEFFQLSIKGDVVEMLDAIKQIRDADLKSSDRRFIEDNLQVLIYRQQDNPLKISKEIRKLVKDDIDLANPGTVIAQHLTNVLEKDTVLQPVFIKLTGLGGLKGEIHRKFICALLGSVQIGGGGRNREDLVFVEKEYTINISTRFYTEFGEINLGAWSLTVNDPEEYLSEPELGRLKDGAPEEKQALRRRIIMESIAQKFEKRAFLIHVTQMDGTVFTLGWDIGSCLRNAYKAGKVVVRAKKNTDKDAVITDNGDIVPLLDYEILYIKETGEMDDGGKPEETEVPFIERRDSILYLTADLTTLQDASGSMSGLFFHETPYTGNPSDLQRLRQCVPDIAQLLGKQCI